MRPLLHPLMCSSLLELASSHLRAGARAYLSKNCHVITSYIVAICPDVFNSTLLSATASGLILKKVKKLVIVCGFENCVLYLQRVENQHNTYYVTNFV